MPPPDPDATAAQPPAGEPPTDPDATTAQPGAGAPPADPDATTVQPGAGAPPPPPGGEPPPAAGEPTTVQPTVGPAGMGAAGAGAAMGAGGPPGPPFDEYGDGYDDEPPDWRPKWLLPAAIALLVALIIGLIAVLATRGDDEESDDSSTTSSSEVSTTTEPVFVPVDSGAVSTSEQPTTTPAAATTTAAPTTVAPTEAPTTTAAPTTVAPTEAPTTQAPTTQPPTTVPALPDPGFAFVDSETLQIESTCLVQPDQTGELEIVAYLVQNASGPIVIERWFDDGSNGVDVDYARTGQHAAASPVDSNSVTDPFSATATGDVTVDVVVNPPPGGPIACQDSITTDEGGTRRNYAVLDVCAAGDDVAGIGTEGTSFTAVDNGDGTAALTFSDRTSGPMVDPAAPVDIDESIYNYTGTVIGGGRSLDILIDLDLATPRGCSADEAP
jgi:hypothetical protein